MPTTPNRQLSAYRTAVWIPLAFDVIGLASLAAAALRAALSGPGLGGTRIVLALVLAAALGVSAICAARVLLAGSADGAPRRVLTAYALTFGGLALAGWLSGTVLS
ncbi:Na+/phosphate symporter [Allocatelliglobosispora scoriae]|uniref:Na+/phosphate symporter n=1 Tax=Allocatelliglobosispora scoriae TaxID=643052 RepID=A0A841BC23_9ACTN|nr:hypothetical protein [Allocatelliglobosispora scoriae]MBB5866657.1 Na+/phosphate symporter [Allocatelliglobosispora scoriae]